MTWAKWDKIFFEAKQLREIDSRQLTEDCYCVFVAVPRSSVKRWRLCKHTPDRNERVSRLVYERNRRISISDREPYNFKSVNQIVSVNQTTAQVCYPFHFTTSLLLYAAGTGSKANTFSQKKKRKKKKRKKEEKKKIVERLYASWLRFGTAKCIRITVIIRRFTSLGLHVRSHCAARESQLIMNNIIRRNSHGFPFVRSTMRRNERAADETTIHRDCRGKNWGSATSDARLK